MANYFPQADPNGNCCDCPERATPCDPCGRACCIDNVCYDMSPEDCVANGGTPYAGHPCTDTVFSCAESPGLVCDSISASLTKCGFSRSDPDDPGNPVLHFYLFLGVSWSGSAHNDTCPFGEGDCSWSVGTSENYSYNLALDEHGLPTDCICSHSGGGSGSISGSDTGCPADGGGYSAPSGCTPPYAAGPSIGSNWSPPANWGSMTSICGIPVTVTNTSSLTVDHENDVVDCTAFTGADPPLPCPYTGSLDIYSTFSGEYTTDQLIAYVVEMLPSYDNDFGDACSAIRNLSDDESSYNIRRFIPRFVFLPTSSSRTLTYNEHLVPAVGSPSDTARSLSVGAGIAYVTGPEVFEPDANGEITITNIVLA